MQWDPAQVLAKAEKDYEKEWMKTVNLSPKSNTFRMKDKGKPLLVQELAQKMRATLISMGFEEVCLPAIVNEEQVRKEYGPQARLVLDTCYFLGQTKKPGLELTQDLKQKIQVIAPSLEDKKFKAMKKILTDYANDKIKGDTLAGIFVSRLGLRMEQATQIISMFPGYSHQEKEIGKQTLCSAITHPWLETLAVISKKEPAPLQLFSTCTSFTRERAEDHLHVRAYPTATAVIMDEGIALEDGQLITQELLKQVGVDGIEFKKEKATTKQFIPATQYSVYAKGKTNTVKIGYIGMYSPIALSNYSISVPVFKLCVYIGHTAMVVNNISDVREVICPQFYAEWEMTDKEIQGLVQVKHSPETQLGKEIAKKIVKTCELYALQASPCDFKVIEKEVDNHRLEVWVGQEEKGTTLCGSGTANEVYIKDGNIVALPPTPKGKETKIDAKARKGIRTGISLLRAVADYAASEIEKGLIKEKEFEFGEIKEGEQVNILVPDMVQRYVKRRNRVLSIQGKVNLKIHTKVKRLWEHEQPR